MRDLSMTGWDGIGRGRGAGRERDWCREGENEMTMLAIASPILYGTKIPRYVVKRNIQKLVKMNETYQPASVQRCYVVRRLLIVLT